MPLNPILLEERKQKQRDEIGNIMWNQDLEEFGDPYTTPGIMGERM